MKIDDSHHAYARLLLESGLNLKPGMKLLISSEPVHWPILNVVAETAYQMGAAFVQVFAQHPGLGKARIDHASEAFLSYVPPWIEHRIDECAHGDWAMLSFAGSEDPYLLANIDQSRNAIIQRANRKVGKPLQDACGAGRVPWCVAALPTPAWAGQALGCAPSPEAEEELWNIMKPILRLDKDDPSQAWRDNAAQCDKRGKALSAESFDAFHFSGPGTDLTVYSNANHLWEGGNLVADNQQSFIPNIPTEEVFTTPDWRKTEGRATVTRPVEVLGGDVCEAWFEFEAGRVVKYGASEGPERLVAFFEIDEQARYLGEVALVDGHSPVYTSGKIFHNILYDENAACHIALGSGYPTCVKGGVDMNPEEQSAAGINQCLLHTDFMIGSESVTVTGKKTGQADVAIITDGLFHSQFS
jgi:aminopeptidase